MCVVCVRAVCVRACVCSYLLLQCLSHLLDAGALDELGQLEGRLLDTPLALQVLALEAPVARHGHGVPRGLQVHQQLGLLRRHVVHLHHIGARHQLRGERSEGQGSGGVPHIQTLGH